MQETLTLERPAEYQEEMKGFRFHLWPMLNMAKSFVSSLKLKDDQSILDFGCHTGDLSALLAERYPKSSITAWTPVPDLLPEAVHSLEAYPNAQAHSGPFVELTLEGSVNTIISCYTLHVCPDKAQAMSEMWNALKPKGRCYLQFPVLHGRKRFEDTFELQLCLSKPWSEYFKDGVIKLPGPPLVAPDEIGQVATKQGFQVESAEVVRYEHLFQNRTQFSTWLSTKVLHLLQVPEDKRVEFLNAVVDCYLQVYPADKKGCITYFEHLFELELRKP